MPSSDKHSHRDKERHEKASWHVKTLDEIREEKKRRKEEEDRKKTEDSTKEMEVTERSSRQRKQSSGDENRIDEDEDDALNIQPPQAKTISHRDNKHRKEDKRKHGRSHSRDHERKRRKRSRSTEKGKSRGKDSQRDRVRERDRDRNRGRDRDATRDGRNGEKKVRKEHRDEPRLHAPPGRAQLEDTRQVSSIGATPLLQEDLRQMIIERRVESRQVAGGDKNQREAERRAREGKNEGLQKEREHSTERSRREDRHRERDRERRDKEEKRDKGRSSSRHDAGKDRGRSRREELMDGRKDAQRPGSNERAISSSQQEDSHRESRHKRETEEQGKSSRVRSPHRSSRDDKRKWEERGKADRRESDHESDHRRSKPSSKSSSRSSSGSKERDRKKDEGEEQVERREETRQEQMVEEEEEVEEEHGNEEGESEEENASSSSAEEEEEEGSGEEEEASEEEEESSEVESESGEEAEGEEASSSSEEEEEEEGEEEESVEESAEEGEASAEEKEESEMEEGEHKDSEDEEDGEEAEEEVEEVEAESEEGKSNVSESESESESGSEEESEKSGNEAGHHNEQEMEAKPMEEKLRDISEIYVPQTKSKFDDSPSPLGGNFKTGEEDRNQASDTEYLQDTPPASPIELEEKLPPYLPAVQGCRSVEEFQCLNRIAEGTYGVVYRAKEKKKNEIVALKRLKMEKEKEGFPITSLREISTLLKAQHRNIVTVREIVVGSNMDKIYIVMDYVEHDLKSLMETMKQPFTIGETKCLMLQLLRGVHHLHDNWILHRDLKTSNLLLNHQGCLKIGDFGLAREYGSPIKPYTSIVVTLWYRAPELLLGTKVYSTPIDMWSVGCIFAEFLTMKPTFNGRSEIDQLNRIFKELGTPSEKIWPGYNELPAVKKTSFAIHPYNNLRSKFGTYLTDMGFELLNRFLTYDPVRRITAEDALKNSYFNESPQPIDESMFPTWPAKSEMVRTNKPRSPQAPEGGQQFAKLERDDSDSGFRMALPTQGSSAQSVGFSLKF